MSRKERVLEIANEMLSLRERLACLDEELGTILRPPKPPRSTTKNGGKTHRTSGYRGTRRATPRKAVRTDNDNHLRSARVESVPKQVLKLVKDEPSRMWSVADLAARCKGPGSSQQNIRNAANRLVEAGKIARPEPGRYQAISTGDPDA